VGSHYAAVSNSIYICGYNIVRIVVKLIGVEQVPVPRLLTGKPQENKICEILLENGTS
jgi:hypothetical protein